MKPFSCITAWLQRRNRTRIRSSRRGVLTRQQWNCISTEVLEDRTLLAGNVLASVRGPDLVIQGDAQDNSVVILIENGNLTVRGFDNTTINGTDSFVATTGAEVRDDLRVSLGDGADTLTILPGVVIRDDTVLDTGAGNDLLSLDSTVIGDDLYVRTRAGDDQVNLLNVNVGDDNGIATSSGADSISLQGGRVGDDLTLFSQGGADNVVVDTVSIFDDTRILGGSEDDQIVVVDSFVDDDMGVSGGSGNDFVNVNNMIVRDDVGLFGSSGDDVLVAEGTNQFGDDFRQDGQSGNDSVSVSAGTSIRDNVRVRSESTTVDGSVITTNTNAANSAVQATQDAATALINPVAVNDDFNLENNDTLVTVTANGVLANDSDAPIGGTTTVSLLTNAGNGNVALNDDGSFTYTADANFNGTDTFTYQATNEFGGTATATASIDVNQVDLTLDVSSNGALQSSGTLVTNQSTFTIDGVTEPGATVSVDRDGDNAFDDGSTTADGSGNFSIDVTLLNDSNNLGANNLVVRSQVTGGGERTESVDVHFAEGSVVRFDLSIGGASDSVDIELLDQDAPNVVANFLTYINDGDYSNSIIHRSVNQANFAIIQGGGFTFDSGNGQISNVTTDPPVDNEFNPANSNVRGTLSTAQIGGDINSFTSQYFVNVIDNTFLDDIPHTVFGRVIGTGMDVVDAINALPTFNVNAQFPPQTALTDVPLTNNFEAGTTPNATNFVSVSSVARILAPSS
ncbi:MAG: hypothetical protein CMJ78_18445 [Planctomycetaceae bacterium]|nr:hypothetical protein [Planctomycetaceae bacterium]